MTCSERFWLWLWQPKDVSRLEDTFTPRRLINVKGTSAIAPSMVAVRSDLQSQSRARSNGP